MEHGSVRMAHPTSRIYRGLQAGNINQPYKRWMPAQAWLFCIG
jgi:hypothetical protein